jgi:hypothetical protein
MYLEQLADAGILKNKKRETNPYQFPFLNNDQKYKPRFKNRAIQM